MFVENVPLKLSPEPVGVNIGPTNEGPRVKVFAYCHIALKKRGPESKQGVCRSDFRTSFGYIATNGSLKNYIKKVTGIGQPRGKRGVARTNINRQPQGKALLPKNLSESNCIEFWCK